MTTINLALRGLYGPVVHGGWLRNQKGVVYRVGFNGRRFVREVRQPTLTEDPRSAQLPRAPAPEPNEVPDHADSYSRQWLLFEE